MAKNFHPKSTQPNNLKQQYSDWILSCECFKNLWSQPGPHGIKHFALDTWRIDAKRFIKSTWLKRTKRTVFKHNAPLCVSSSSIKCNVVYVMGPSAGLSTIQEETRLTWLIHLTQTGPDYMNLRQVVREVASQSDF